MDSYHRMRILLRLAELCTPNESERRNSYMDEIDDLLNNPNCPLATSYGETKDLFDFNAPKEAWSWVLVTELLNSNLIRDLYDNSCMTLGRKLSGLSKEGCGVRRKRTNKGSLYFLPPLKDFLSEEPKKENVGGYLDG